MKIKVQNKYYFAFIELERFSFSIVPQSCVYFTEDNKGAAAAEGRQQPRGDGKSSRFPKNYGGCLGFDVIRGVKSFHNLFFEDHHLSSNEML